MYKSVKIALLLSNVIDADHQNNYFFTNKSHFSPPLLLLIGVPDRHLEHIITIDSL